MKNLIFTFLLSLVTFLGYSQTALDVINSHGVDVQTEQVSFANPWIGSTLAYNLDEDQPLSESILFSATVLNVIASGDGWAVPVVGEVGLGDGDILSSGSGLNLGLYPFYRLTGGQGVFQLYAHGGVGYKVITEDVGVGEKAPQQIRALVGLEATFNTPEGRGPTTLSVTPVYMFNSNSALENAGGLEISFVLPVGAGLGLFTEGLVPFESSDFNSGLRLGVIVNGKL